MFPAFSYQRPRSLQAAIDSLAQQGGHIHAGGTDLLGCVHDQVFAVERVVSLQAVDGLAGVQEQSDGGVTIGAMSTITDVAEHPLLQQRYPVLAQAAAEVASPQLRHQGTLGGNLCQKPRCWYYRGDFPCLRKGGKRCYAVGAENQYHCIFGGANCFIVHPSDTAPALVALDADVRIAGPQGQRTLPVAELHMPPAIDPTRETVLEPGEVITAVHIPAAAQNLYSSYRKVRTRRSWDFAVAGCALALEMEGDRVRDCRIVLAAAAPIPWRSKEAENALRGQRLNDESIARAADAAMAGAQPMNKNAYKIPLFKGVLTEELGKARQQGAAT